MSNRRSSAFAILAAMLLATTLIAGAEETKQSSDPRSATVTAEGLHRELQACHDTPLVVDVREPQEFEAAHIEGALLAPLSSVVESLAKVQKDRDIVLVCRSGNRSGKAQKILAEKGFTKLRNMEGGMLAWRELGYSVVTGK